VTSEELGEAFLQDRRLRGLARSTLVGYSQAWRDFSRYCDELGKGPVELRPEDLVRYRLELQRQPLHPLIARGRFWRVRTILRWGYQRGELLLDPGWDMTEKAAQWPARALLSVEQVQAWLGTPDAETWVGQRDRTILEVLYGAGLRLGECARLDLDDLNRQGKTLLVRASKSGDRHQPLGDRLAQVLEHYVEVVRPQRARAGERALWVTRHGGRVSQQNILIRVSRAAREAGLVGASSHSLRHAFATHLLEGGSPLWAVQALLGHRCIVATQRYTHLLPLELIREYRRTHPRARRSRSRA